MNVRIFWVCAMECMCAQTRPQFILSSKRVFRNEVRTSVNSKRKIPSTEDSDSGEDWTHGLQNAGQRAQHTTDWAILAHRHHVSLHFHHKILPLEWPVHMLSSSSPGSYHENTACVGLVEHRLVSNPGRWNFGHLVTRWPHSSFLQVISCWDDRVCSCSSMSVLPSCDVHTAYQPNQLPITSEIGVFVNTLIMYCKYQISVCWLLLKWMSLKTQYYYGYRLQSICPFPLTIM